MANTYKVLAQGAPATQSDFTVGAGKSWVVSTLVICNTTTAAATYRIHARIAGATLASSNAIVLDATVNGNTTTALTLGITLTATDVLSVISGTSGSLTVTAFGNEIS